MLRCVALFPFFVLAASRQTSRTSPYISLDSDDIMEGTCGEAAVLAHAYRAAIYL